jgi:hypothetical protein
VNDTTKPAQSWAVLTAQGVKRCCATFTNGKRCRRRASEAFEFSWCDIHGPAIKRHTDYANAAIAAQKRSDDK